MGTSYTIQIAGKDFKVSSTDKEEHIRDVEKKLTSTFEELGSKSVDYQDSFK
ncbi:MAG: cell division protein ZapA (FtsZ GTPase activity inhibitor), partial [bacterium]